MNSLIEDETITKPTDEEHAYHLGWCAYFDDKSSPICNPYNCIHEHALCNKWFDGYETAKSIAINLLS